MLNTDLLDAILTQCIGTVLGRSLNAEGIIDLIRESNSFYIESKQMICSIDGDRLVFFHDFPEFEEYNCSMFISKAVDFLQERINELYQNDNIKAQIMG